MEKKSDTSKSKTENIETESNRFTTPSNCHIIIGQIQFVSTNWRTNNGQS